MSASIAKYKRIVLKLSGEALQGKLGFGIDPRVLDHLAKQIRDVKALGVEVAVVVGGGNSGVEEGLFLTKFAKKVTVLEVRDQLGASQILREKAASHPQMEVRLGTTVEEFRGNGKLSSVIIKNVASGEVEELKPGAVFIFIGLDPNVDFLQGTVDLDQFKFISTGLTLETSLGGVFAAGDVRGGSTKQVASAVGEGATAALMIRQYLEKHQGSRGYRGD